MVEMQSQQLLSDKSQGQTQMQIDQTSAQLASLSLLTEPVVSRNAPSVFLVMGMAGSGKTTFVHRLIAYLNEHGKKTYVVNLDPAVLEVAYPCNIDIRDSVKYKKVMKSYSLGPNGAILTCLNLFAAQFD